MPLTKFEREQRDLRESRAAFASSLIEFCEVGPDQWTLKRCPCLDRRPVDQGFAVPVDFRGIARGHLLYYEGKRFLVTDIIPWERYNQLVVRYLGGY